MLRFLLVLCVGMAMCSFALAQTQGTGSQASEEAHKVPLIDGGAGPCSLELTINDPDGKPVYAARIKVHINYRFGGFHKIDLEAGTNVDGKVKFTGLPDRVHRPPLEFHAVKDDMQGMATYDPTNECQGKHEISLSKSAPPSQ